MPYNKSFIDQASSVNMAGYWPRSLFAFSWTSTSSRSIKTQKENSTNIQPSWPRTWPVIYTYWAIQRYTQVYRANNNTQMYRANHSYRGLYRAIHSYTRLYTTFEGLYTAILGYTEVYTGIQGYTWESEWVTGLHRLLVWFCGSPRMIALQLDFWKKELWASQSTNDENHAGKS